MNGMLGYQRFGVCNSIPFFEEMNWSNNTTLYIAPAHA